MARLHPETDALETRHALANSHIQAGFTYTQRSLGRCPAKRNYTSNSALVNLS